MMNAILMLAALSPDAAASLPRPAIGPELRATNCAVADERKRLLREGEAALEAAKPLMEDATRRMEARAHAVGDQLIARGVWTETDRARFSLAMLGRPEFKAHLAEVTSILDAMMRSVDTLAAAPKDEALSCRVMLDMLGQVDRSAAAADDGWRIIEHYYAEEAQRLGVSLN
ncbi:hypothetical protein E2493_10710 [Sphingomonas parva]|uniref:Uncharacterized protein n=1 Tax=Sphingomonas parva TaxID=2555898 RepID=A0A4Y8ZQH6_9SPHN|nr:hypothetical protein [Sphingomonas parva]TFI58253.1 hypothetical protein E2493_10710 [Sphingomonas parva]